MPPPETPVTQVNDAERDLGGEVLQVVAARIDDLQRAALPGAPLGDRHDQFAGEIFAGERIRVAAIRSATWPWAMISPPWMPAPGPMSSTWSAVRIASSSCSTTITVLPRSRRRCSVTSSRSLSRWCRPMRRLVEHVEHAGEAGADLRGQANALALAARQRAGAARQRQIFEADIDQELEPLADFLQDADGDLHLLLGEVLRQRGEPLAGALDRHLGDVADVLVARS